MFSDISICAQIQNAAHKRCCSFYIEEVAQTYRFTKEKHNRPLV